MPLNFEHKGTKETKLRTKGFCPFDWEKRAHSRRTLLMVAVLSKLRFQCRERPTSSSQRLHRHPGRANFVVSPSIFAASCVMSPRGAVLMKSADYRGKEQRPSPIALEPGGECREIGDRDHQ